MLCYTINLTWGDLLNKIIFHSNKIYNKFNLNGNPTPSKKIIPKWFSNADRYLKDSIFNKILINEEGGLMPSFKACPSLMDFYTSGYMYTTPCDLTFYKDKNNNINVKTETGFEDFCMQRDPMKDFYVPSGYQDFHFHWYPNWAPSLPEGYSAMYLNPVNRFDLPFLTISGIIDNDKMDTPGLMPFFIREGFEGTIPAGTPYVQIIPFKREDWEMDFKFYEYDEIIERHNKQASKFRTKDGGAYKEHVWSKKKYK